MLDLKSLVAGSVAFVLMSVAVAQGTSTPETPSPGATSGSGTTSSSGSSGASSDPFVDCRNQVAAAKSAYNAGKIGKQEFEQEKKMAQDKLKASGVRASSEKNLECN